jgi:hypothetical protein
MPDVDPSIADSAGALERVAIRTRESLVTLAGWRLCASTPAGSGSITRIDGAAGARFRGEGAYLGWPQARLAAEYQRLLPKGEDPAPDPGQFG